MAMPKKIRNKLCKKCLEIIRIYEKDYQNKNREIIRKRRRKHYIEKERKRPSKKDEQIKTLKKSINKMKNIY